LFDGDLEIRLYATKRRDPQGPHDPDEPYILVAGTGHFRCGDRLTAADASDLVYTATHEAYRFEDFTDDFPASVIFYGPQK